MVWNIRITKTAEKQIKFLDKTLQFRIVAFLKKVDEARNPRNYGKELKGNKTKLWRYRIGHYRLICHIDDDEKKLSVLEVAHRKEIYR